ncbi:FAD-binding oxidoreductase [Rhodobacteraceae bacterium CCMM004]|nr:FAD-binding oxidoreductase [Rhodobacteraceae bacterium CCMM004]
MRWHDLAVIGGGLAGVATAYFAARAGADVVLLERRDLNLGASGSNAGSIHAQIPFDPYREMGEGWARHFSETIPLFRASIARWRTLEAELGGSLGVAIKGGVMAAGTEADLRALERKVEIERAAGLPVEMWDRETLRARAPFLSDTLLGAAWCAEEGKADPFRAVPLIARRAVEAGLDVRRNAPVAAVEQVAGGWRVAGPWGAVHARKVVNAAGADAAHVAALAGVRLPIEGHLIQVAVTEKRAEELPFLLYFTGARLTLKQAAEGGYLIGGGWPARAGPLPMVDQTSMIRNLAVAQAMLPSLAGAQVVRAWAATVNGTADWRPILGEVPGRPGFFLNLFPWMGFTAAPAVSEAIAALALGQTPQVDLSPFAWPGEGA